MTYDQQNIYAGIFQAWSWMQGRVNGPMACRIPDDHLVVVGISIEEFDFNLADFMDVVSDLDSDSTIYYWRYVRTHAGDEYLWLACTEDDYGALVTDEYYSSDAPLWWQSIQRSREAALS